MRKLVTHERGLHVLFAVLAATALLLCGWWMRLPILDYTRPSNQEDFNRYVFDKFAYSAIASLYFRDSLVHHPLPYFDYSLEYPPGTGLIIYFPSSAAQDMPQYFLLTSLFMGL
jgi:Zn-dependent protease